MRDPSSMFSLERWDLAPGEAISQSPPGRVRHGLRTPVCPAPTLDTDGFISHNALSDDDCSSLDSFAGFGLAPGEIRSQVPLRTFYESEPERGPPPTLDTQGILNDIESEASLMVEDSLPGWEVARGDHISQGTPFELPNSLSQWGPFPLHSTELRHNGIILGEDWRVEDSQIGRASAPGDDREAGPGSQVNNFKSLCFAYPVNVPGHLADDSECKALSPSNRMLPVNCVVETGIMGRIEGNTVAPFSPVGKRSLSRCSPLSESEKSKKQAKLDSGTDFSNFISRHLPAPFTGRSLFVEGDEQKVSIPRSPESPRDRNGEVTNMERSGPVTSPLTKHMPQTADPLTASKMKAVADDIENVFCRTSPARRTPLTDVTNSRSPTVLISKTNASGTPTKESTESDRNRRSEGALRTSRDNPSLDHLVSTSSVRLPAGNGVAPEHDEGKGTEVDAGRIGKRRDRGAKVKAKFPSSLGVKKGASREARQQDLRRDPEGWLCPKDPKAGRPRSRQPSLDRFLI